MNSQFDPEASFPYQFVLKAATKDANFSKKFIQLSKDQKYPITSDKIFTISEKNQPEEIEIDKSEVILEIRKISTVLYNFYYDKLKIGMGIV